MIKLGENNFLLADADGSEIPFSASELQGELIYCFLSAGLRDSTCFAEDIALAVEYSLHEKYEFSGKVSTAELSSMVVETLENAGFFTVADWFKRRNGRQLEELHLVTAENLHKIALQQGMLFPVGSEEKILKQAAAVFGFMNVTECPISLITEMLRFFYEQEKNSAKNQKKTDKKSFKGDYLVELKEVADSLPEFLQELLAKKIIQIHDITVYHPSIRLFLDCGKYAEFAGFEGVMTEMMWSPHAIRLARSMDSAIESMQQMYENKCSAKKLPVYLTVNNLEGFMKKYFGAGDGNTGKLAKSIVESLSSEMFYDIYRVRF